MFRAVIEGYTIVHEVVQPKQSDLKQINTLYLPINTGKVMDKGTIGINQRNPDNWKLYKWPGFSRWQMIAQKE